jgi:MFS family permease
MRKRLIKWLNDEFDFLHGNVLVIIIGSIFTTFAQSIVNPFRSVYIRELGATPIILGLLDSFGRTVQTIVRLPGGHFADKYGRKKIIYTMSFGMALSFIFYALAPRWEYILIAVIIANISAIYFPALTALEADSISPETRGKGFAALGFFSRLLAVFSPAIGGLLVDRLGLISGMRIAYGFVTLAFLITAFLRMFYFEETLENPHDFHLSELKNDVITSIISVRETWSALSRNLKAFIFAMAIAGFSGPFYFVFQALYAFDIIGLTSVQWGFLVTVNMLSMIVFSFPSGKFVDRVGRKKSLIVGYIGWIPAVIWYIFARDTLSVLVIFIVSGLSEALFMPAFMALRGDLIPRETRGRVMALFGLIMNLTAIPSSAIAGVLYQWNPMSPFFIYIVLEVITFAFIIRYVQEPMRREV